MRLAAIDIGTNSVHIVIAEAIGQNRFEVLDREREVVQVGRGSFGRNRLKSDAILRTVDALDRFVMLARGKGVERILCTATAAVREATNGGDFLRAARARTGLTPRVIPAEEEGRLVYLAVKQAQELPLDPSLLVDLGGGSAQFVIGDRKEHQAIVSAPLGALRLFELHPLGDPPRPSRLVKLRRHVEETAAPAFHTLRPWKPSRAFGSSGSIHALAHVTEHLESRPPLAQLNGYRLSRDDLERTAERLSRMTLGERVKLPGIDPWRAEVLVPGAVVLLVILDEMGLDAITMSDFGVREGLLADYIATHAREITAVDAVTDLRLRSVLGLLDRFGGDVVHARHVARLALTLYDDLITAHRLEEDARRLLHYAALVHDVGSSLGHEKHAQHSYYIIKNGNLRGLSGEEVEILALVARYHGKTRPRKKDPAYAELGKRPRRIVRWLAAILRIAEALDRSQYQLVQDVKAVRSEDGRVTIRAVARGDARLEVWAARQRTRLLSRLLKARVQIVLKTGDRKRRGAGKRPAALPVPAERSPESAPALALGTNGRGPRVPAPVFRERPRAHRDPEATPGLAGGPAGEPRARRPEPPPPRPRILPRSEPS
jgi:exopolyphosphatase / guanosine-5'-triphosphate,3'-diphosphate pyrophosphatase